jgi:hypothetical protein
VSGEVPDSAFHAGESRPARRQLLPVRRGRQCRNPIEPGTLFTRLQTIGFDHIAVAVEEAVRFRARKPPTA